MSLLSSGNDNNSSILNFLSLQESEDKGRRTRTARPPRVREGGRARWVQHLPYVSAIEKPHKKGPLVPTTLQHSTRKVFGLQPACSARSRVIAPAHRRISCISRPFSAPTKNGVCSNKGKKKGWRYNDDPTFKVQSWSHTKPHYPHPHRKSSAVFLSRLEAPSSLGC